MKAIIFAAGEGTRLRPLTYEMPKPLLQIAGRPILFRIIDSLPRKIDEVFIVVSYLADKIIAATNNEKFSIKINFAYMDLSKERGTWSALWSVKKFIDNENLFLVLNGDDLYAKQELEKVVLENNWVIGYQNKEKPGIKYRNIKIDTNDYIVGMPMAGEDEKIINIATGVYLLNREVFTIKPIKTAAGEWGLPQTISQTFAKKAVKAIKMDNWLQINTLADLKAVNEKYKIIE